MKQFEIDKCERLKILLEMLDVPEKRKTDFGWLLRNLRIRNQGKIVDEALQLIIEIMKEQ